MLSFKPVFSLSSFIFIKSLFSSSSLSAIRVVSSVYLRLLRLLLTILIPAYALSSLEFHMMCSASDQIRSVAHSCPTLCDPMGCSLPGSFVYGDSPGKSTGVGCHALLQGIFPTQGLNPSLPHCRWILYWLSHKGEAQEYWSG